jgi:transposase
MLTLPPTVRVYIALDPVDMRRSFDALSADVQRLGMDPLSGHLFCFLNKTRQLLKLLFFDRSGYCIYYKRLEVGTFQLPRVEPGQNRVELDPAELGLILEGIDLSAAVRRKRYRRPNQRVPEN